MGFACLSGWRMLRGFAHGRNGAAPDQRSAAASRALSMKVCATGARNRFFKVMTASGRAVVGSSRRRARKVCRDRGLLRTTRGIESGKIRPLAAFTPQRSSMLPDVATAHEQGLDLEIPSWTALFRPKGTPASIVERLHDAADAAIEAPTIRERLHQVGVEPVLRENRSPDFLQHFVEREVTKWAAAIKAAGLAP